MEARGFTGSGFFCAFWPQCRHKIYSCRSRAPIEVLASAPGALYSVAKAVPGFLHASDHWRWLINNA
eukprot:879710-Amphidinium_carterae.1